VRHYDPELQAFSRRLVRRGLHRKAAICAVAAKLLRRLYAVLSRGESYRTYASQRIHGGEKPVRVSVHEVAGELLKDLPEPASRPAPYVAAEGEASPRTPAPRPTSQATATRRETSC
jgi:hypothetical protein